jgi:CheY-like chemotaxis protein
MSTMKKNAYSVEVIGFNQTERIVLSSIFGLSARRQPKFTQHSSVSFSPDLFLVDSSDAQAMALFNERNATRRVPAIMIGESDHGSGYPLLARPLQWTRLFKAFDLAIANDAAAQSEFEKTLPNVIPPASLASAGVPPTSLYSTMPGRMSVPPPQTAPAPISAPTPIVAPAKAFSSPAMPPAVAAAVAAFEPISFLKPSQPLPAPVETTPIVAPSISTPQPKKYADLRSLGFAHGSPATPASPVIPTAAVVSPPAPVAPEIVAEMPVADWVLVVDDNLTVREFMRSKLAPFNFNVDYAESGEQAVGLTGHRRYACVFLDVVMPGIDGYQVCKLIKSKKSQGKTHVVMLTSKGSPFDKIRGAMAGCDAYLTKPVDEEKLLETIVRFLPNRV